METDSSLIAVLIAAPTRRVNVDIRSSAMLNKMDESSRIGAGRREPT
jgi:hypothetical protein